MPKDPNVNYIRKHIRNQADAARLIARTLALKRLLAATERPIWSSLRPTQCHTRVTPTACNSLINRQNR